MDTMEHGTKRRPTVQSSEIERKRARRTQNIETDNVDAGVKECQVHPDGVNKALQSTVDTVNIDAEKRKCQWQPKIVHINDLPLLHRAIVQNRTDFVEDLLNSGTDVNERDRDGCPAIKLAVYLANLDMVELLLKRGADVNYTDSYGISLVGSAVRRGDASLLAILLKYNASLVATNPKNTCPLLVAIKNENLQMVQTLLNAGADPDAVYTSWINKGQTALHLAIELNQIQITDSLLQHGADVNAKYAEGAPLHLACNKESSFFVKVLLDNGADVNLSVNGDAPIHVAVKKTSRRILELLLERGADVNLPSNSGTPFHVACTSGNLFAVKTLSEHPTFELTRCCGQTPLSVALENGHYHIANYLIQVLRVDVDERVGGYTPLHLACRDGDRRRVEYLIHKKASVHAHKEGNTPLHYACYRGCQILVGVLIHHGADLNTKNTTDGTPVHIALIQGNLSIFKRLCKTNFDPDIEDFRGRTPLQLAVKTKTPAMVAYLLKRNPSRYTDGNKAAFLKTLEKPKYAEMFNMLCEYGFRLNIIERLDPKYLHFAIEKDNVALVEGLLQSGDGSVHSRTGIDSVTPLHTAVGVPSFPMAHLLLKRGADPNGRCAQGKTPLVTAIIRGCIHTVTLLLDHGADVHATTDPDGPPLRAAMSECTLSSSLAIPKMLLDRGANPNLKVEGDETLFVQLLRDDDIGRQTKLLLTYGSKCSGAEIKKLILSGEISHNALNLALAFDFAKADLILEPDSENWWSFWWEPDRMAKIMRLINLHSARTFAAGTCVRKDQPRQFTNDRIADEVNILHEQCVAELDCLHKKEIGYTGITLKHMLLKDITKVVGYLRNPDISEALKRKVSSSEFPIYGEVVNLHIQKARTRKSLLDLGLKYFEILFSSQPKLFPELQEHILSLLDDRDLRIFIEVSKDVKRKRTRSKRLE